MIANCNITSSSSSSAHWVWRLLKSSDLVSPLSLSLQFSSVPHKSASQWLYMSVWCIFLDFLFCFPWILPSGTLYSRPSCLIFLIQYTFQTAPTLKKKWIITEIKMYFSNHNSCDLCIFLFTSTSANQQL